MVPNFPLYLVFCHNFFFKGEEEGRWKREKKSTKAIIEFKNLDNKYVL